MFGESNSESNNAISIFTVASSTTTETSRRLKRLFDDSDMKLIQRLCAEFIMHKPISSSAVEETLNNPEEGNDFLKTYTIFQIVNKIKYERIIYRETR